MYTALPLWELMLMYTPWVALPFGAHMWYNKAIPGTNTGSRSHWAARSLKTKVEVHPQSMSGDISLSSRRHRCSYVWLIRQPLQGPGLLARPHHNPPPHFTFSHLSSPPAPPAKHAGFDVPSSAEYVTLTLLTDPHNRTASWKEDPFRSSYPPPPTHLQRPC